MLKIVFMGTPDFAQDSLKAIVESGHKVLAVITTPDTHKGRKLLLQMPPVKEYALKQNLKVYQPEKLKNNEEIVKTIKQLNPDIICVVAYGKILPKEILEIPKLGVINVHPSLLPNYRGSAPIQWAIINGEKLSGVTIMYLNEEMDAGDIILKKESTIEENETIGEVWERFSNMGAKLLIEALNQIEKGVAPRIKQEGIVTYAPMLQKEISKIDWNNKKTEEIRNLIRGLNPIMGTYTFLNNKKYKIWTAENATNNTEIKTTKGAVPGEIVFIDSKKGMYIKTIDGIISVKEIQAENSKKMDISDFLRGNKIQIGDIFI